MEWLLPSESWCNTSPPPLFNKAPHFFCCQEYHTQQLLCLNTASNKQSKMSGFTIDRSSNCHNTTNSYNNVWNNCNVADDRSQLLAWLSPLDPGLRHRDIQECRVNNVGARLIQTEEFRRWYGEGQGDKGVLFCYGDPGVGKTFIR